MPDKPVSRVRYGEAFWRAHHEGWRCSGLNQREYCEAQGIPLKAFGNWRAKFKAEPQPAARKLLYRRGGLSHTLSHSLSHSLSHMTYGLPEQDPSFRRPGKGTGASSARLINARSLLRQCSRVRASPRLRDAMGSRRVFCSAGNRSSRRRRRCLSRCRSLMQMHHLVRRPPRGSYHDTAS
jgi:hypothetical protein